MKTSFQTLLLGAGFGVAFLLGQAFPRSTAPDLPGRTPINRSLEAQGRGPVNPPPAAATPRETAAEAPIVYTEEGGSGASANGFVAVTGSYGVGTSVLYLIDTVNRQLAVYEARGGSAEQRRIVMVGARRIDLDLQLHGYNDRSEFEYEDLEKLFEKRGKKDRSVKTGLNGRGRSKK